MTADMTAKLIAGFDKAIARLEKPGTWQQGDYGDSATAQCSVGHLRTAFHYHQTPFDRGSYDEARDLLHDAVPGGDIVEWNDAPERTQGEVIALFKKVRASLAASVTP